MSVLKFDFSAMKDRMVFLIQIDGLAFDPFKRLLDEGRLPNFSKLLESIPGSVGQVITTYPSATAPSLPEFFTGRWSRNFFRHPRKINAFDRVQKRALKYEFIPEAWEGELIDLFDIFRQRGERILSFFSGEFNAGAVTYHDSVAFGIDAFAKFSGMELDSYDHKVMDKLIEFFNKGEPYPRLTFLGINAVDLAGHFQGPQSDLYAAMLIDTDAHFGRLIEALKNNKDKNNKPIFDKSIFIIFGDHGMLQSDKFIDLISVLKSEGLKAADLGSLSHLVSEKFNPFWMVDREILSVPGGSNITELYVRHKRDLRLLDWDVFCPYSELRNYPLQTWFHDGKIDLIGTLSEIEGVGEVLVPIYENVVHVITKDKGSATIFRRTGLNDDSFAYRVDDPSKNIDPFGYFNDSLTSDLVGSDVSMTPENYVGSEFDHNFHSIGQWINSTLNTNYPAAVPLIPKAFSKHQTTSDIIVNAKSSYNFSKYFKGDHGVLEKGCVTTGMIIAGPGVKAGASLDGFMLIDTLPTLLEIIGIRNPPTFDRFLDGRIHRQIIEK